MRILLLLTFTALICSCHTNNIVADISTINASPLQNLDLHFKIDAIEEDSDYYSTANNYEMKQYLYKTYPQFFKNSSDAFAIKIKITGADVRLKSFHNRNLFADLTAGLFPNKKIDAQESKIEVSPAKPTESDMFHLKFTHYITMTCYMTSFYPTALMLREKKADNVEIDTTMRPKPSDKFYLKYVSQKIVSELSKLKLEVLKD